MFDCSPKLQLIEFCVTCRQNANWGGVHTHACSLLNCFTTFHCSTPVQCSISFFFNYVIFCPLIILQIFSDVACHRKILDAKVKCPNRDCTWTGELRDVRVRIDHFTLRFFAPFQPSTLFNLYCNQIDTSLWRLRRISHKLLACSHTQFLTDLIYLDQKP